MIFESFFDLFLLILTMNLLIKYNYDGVGGDDDGVGFDGDFI